VTVRVVLPETARETLTDLGALYIRTPAGGRMPLVEALLAQYGIESGRFHWGWISGAEAPKWAKLVRDFTEQVRDLGPLDWQRELASKVD
jgi:coenzyme F420-reducing hydrogenase delta subunit